MASLDSLAPDQKAVLQLVLQRGRSYDEIAKLLSIDRTAVRQRALQALAALGPQTGVDEQHRALITDYLLGQLQPEVAQQTRDWLANSPSDRAWARVVSSELAPLAAKPLPEIPADSAATAAPAERLGAAGAPMTATAADAPAAAASTQAGAPSVAPRSSRLGGMILIGIAAVAAIVAAVVLITSGGSGKAPASPGASKPSAAATSTATTSATTSASAAHVVGQINLTAPKVGSKAAGIAEVLKEGVNSGIAIVADHVTPNTTRPPNAYAVWLYNSATDARLLGFVNPGVGKNGRLSTAGGLPANAAHYHQLIITLETRADPKTPGIIVLQGALTGLS